MTDTSAIVAALYRDKTKFNEIKEQVLRNVLIPDLFSKKGVEMDGMSANNIAVKCPFHETDTFDSGRIQNRSGVGLYFCNNPTCPVHGKALDVIALNKEFLQKESGEEKSYTASLLDLYVNYMGRPVPQLATPTPAEKAKAEADYKTNLLHLYIASIAKRLLNDPQLGKDGRDYLSARHVPVSFQKAYRIGFIPSGYKISKDLFEKGFDKAFLIEKGILSKNGNDTLFNRIVIPMWGENENPLGEFSFKDAKLPNLYTRTVIIRNDKDKAYKHRYLNRELPLFNLRESLGKRAVILVEGIMDCLSVQNAITSMKSLEPNNGFLNPNDVGVIATYGTNGLSETAMKRYLGGFKTIYLAADNDDNGAGQTANIKRANILKSLFPHVTIKLVTWDQKDANDMLVAGAKPADFWRCLQNAQSLEEFCISNVCRSFEPNKASISKTFEIIDGIAPIITAFTADDPLKVYTFASFVSAKVGIPLDIVLFAILKGKVDNPLEMIAEITKSKTQ